MYKTLLMTGLQQDRYSPLQSSVMLPSPKEPRYPQYQARQRRQGHQESGYVEWKRRDALGWGGAGRE
jgi:hypothetical protein